ncbi:hypothetical protein BDW71DRAFT_210974 [Aspergillus fruticulosus]
MAVDVKVEFDNARAGTLKVPGFNGVPLGAEASPSREFLGVSRVSWYPAPFTARELEILRLMSFLTEWPSWEELGFDASTVETGRNEAVAKFPLISPETWDRCVSELRNKAPAYRETGLVLVSNDGSGVLGTEIKESVTSVMRDGESRTKAQPNQQIWNLLDSSLYLLARGHTRMLINGGSIILEQTLDAYRQGEVAPMLHDEQLEGNRERTFYP